jgi:hypothetical protein
MVPLLLPTAYFPPISWMATLIRSQQSRIEIFETYPKQTFRNRCLIASAAGTLSLSVPVMRINGNHTRTADIRIDSSLNWQMNHWRTLTAAYSKSPFFLYYRDGIESVLLSGHDHLIDLNRDLISVILTLLRARSEYPVETTSYDPDPAEVDLRNAFQAKKTPHQTLFLEMPRYMQVFEEKTGFFPDMSILDLLFNLGPDAAEYLRKLPPSGDWISQS